MEEKINSLKKNGWYVSLEKVTQQLQNVDDEADKRDQEREFLRDPEKWIVNEDLKNVGIPCLPDGINTGKVKQITTPLVLQVKKVEIISAPKNNVESEAAPRMLKFTLTDGKVSCSAIENDHIPKLSLKTPPGAKIRLNGTVKTLNGFLLLDAKNLQLLGGEVPELIEDWKIQQLLLGHVRTQDRDGPPPWVPFGRKIQPLNVDESKGKKTEEEEKVVKDEGFLNQRQDAIAAAAITSGVTKVIMGSGRKLETQQPEIRGRGRERRERNSFRDEERSTKPRDSIRLFEFLQPQIGETHKEENETGYDDALEDEYAVEESQASWQRDEYHRSGRGGPRTDRGQRGYRGRGRSNQSSSYGDTRESHSSRSYQDQDWRGIKSAPSDRGRRNHDLDTDQFNNDRGQSSYRRSFSREGGRRGGRGGSRGYHRDIEDSHFSYGNHRGYPSSRSPVDALVDDFKAWPGLETKPPGPVPTVIGDESQFVSRKAQEQWAVEDFCLAKWEASQQHFPAVIQQLHPDRKSATVMFVESGAVRLVETKYLRRDPQDERERPSSANRSRGKPTMRIYTPRNRGTSRGAW